MKALLITFFSSFCFSLVASVTMTRVDPTLFIANPETDLDKVTVTNEALKRSMVKYLFDADLLDHVGTKAYDTQAVFDTYYTQFSALYRLIDLNSDGLPELIFNGFVSSDDDKEYLEIYGTKKGVVTRLFKEIGHVLAYKIQPNTKEVLLYHHQYPCCENASHNLNRLRLIGNELQLQKRYFIGRDSGMVGPFFPKKVQFTSENKRFSKTTKLYWSPAIITTDAWPRRSQTNVIASYASSSVYTVLAQTKSWSFVLVKSAPMITPKNVINPANFLQTWIYGWVVNE
ncbi:MAG: hypothetical protein KA734_10060 [Fluviicola sp.]|nr:hypothetical protein [Fluviicola sp.]